MKVLKERLPVLDEIDKALAEIYKFNQVDFYFSHLLLFELSQFLATGLGRLRRDSDPDTGVV